MSISQLQSDLLHASLMSRKRSASSREEFQPTSSSAFSSREAGISSQHRKKRRKSLSLLLTMPLDVLYEIFSHLRPRDIMHLSRTSNLFRDNLMCRTSTPIWKAARANVDAPDPPEWMSEPAWTTLLFDHYCESCGTMNVQNVVFRLMKRICGKCKKKHCVLGSTLLQRHSGLTPEILELLPSIHVGWTKGRRVDDALYWEPDVVNLTSLDSKSALDQQQALDELRSIKKARVSDIDENHITWRSWLGHFREERRNELHEQKMHCAEQLKIRFVQLGYETQDLSFIRCRSKEIRNLTDITDKVWARLRVELEPQAKENRDKRESHQSAARQKNRSSRSELLNDQYWTHTQSLPSSLWSSLPTTLELTLMDPVTALIEAPDDNDMEAATVKAFFSGFDAVLNQREEEKETILLSLLPHIPDDQTTSSSTKSPDPLRLASSVFRCKHHKGGVSSKLEVRAEHFPLYFGYNEVAAHQCNLKKNAWRHYWAEVVGCRSFTDSDWESERIAQRHLHSPEMEYEPAGARVVEKILGLLAMDVVTTTVEELDSRVDGAAGLVRFGCSGCEQLRDADGSSTSVEPTRKRQGFGWRALVNHLVADDAQDHNPTCDIFVLPESDRPAFEFQDWCIRQDVAQKRYWACAYCSVHLGQLVDKKAVIEHVQFEHKHLFYEPCEGVDFACVLDTNSDPKAYRFEYCVDDHDAEEDEIMKWWDGERWLVEPI